MLGGAQGLSEPGVGDFLSVAEFVPDQFVPYVLVLLTT